MSIPDSDDDFRAAVVRDYDLGEATWICSSCTFENVLNQLVNEFCTDPLQKKFICNVCECGFKIAEIVEQVKARTGGNLCSFCLYLNPSDVDWCTECNTELAFSDSILEQTVASTHSEPAPVPLFNTATSPRRSESDRSIESEEAELSRLMSDFGLGNQDRARNFQRLRSQDEFRTCDPQDLAEAVERCGDRPDYFDFVAAYFDNECPICYDKFPQHTLLQMPLCPCQLCKLCFYNFVSTSLENNDHVSHLQCPVCNTPSVDDTKQLEDHFSLLTTQIREFRHLDLYFKADKIDLLEERIRDWYLVRDPNFRWCGHCPNGLCLNPASTSLKFQCPTCQRFTCKKCKKPWQTQHEKITCEQFQQWLVENDPEYQEKGVASFLQLNGIQCPKCQFRYALAKGGCMHFTCRQCRAEFCSGCGGFFVRKPGTGLVCVHPRNCLFYLRDFSTDALQRLLTNHKIQFAIDQDGASVPCGVMEQKEKADSSLVDEACGETVRRGNAGLCIKHYNEYLASLINRSRLDPIEVMDANELQGVCHRLGVMFGKAVANNKAELRRLIVAKAPL